MKRILLVLLAATMLLGSLAACKKAPNVEGNQVETGSQNVETGEQLSDIEKRALEKDYLPEDLDFDGAEFRTLCFQEMYDIDVEGTDGSGDMVLDSIYTRNRAVENRLNIVIENKKSLVNRFEEFGEEVSLLANVGSQDYDAIYIMGNAAIQSGYTDSFMDISNLKYISKDAAWWWGDAMREVSFDVNHEKFLIGDICLSNYTRCGTMLVNMTDYERYFQSEGIEGLYDLVLDRKWTVEELKTRVEQSYLDLDGDGPDLEDAGDYVGLFVANIEMIKFMEYAFDVERYDRDEDGCAVLKYDVARASTAVDKLIDLLFESDGVHWQENYHNEKDFAQGRTLFQTTWLSDLLSKEMREMDDLYTMIPLPMLDTTQKEYRTNIQNSAQMAGVLRTMTETDFISAVLEALCTESYRKVVLPFYEVALKIRYAKDTGVGQMIDIINSTATKNFLYEYQPGSGCGVLITNVVMMETNKITSEFITKSQSTQEYLRVLKERLYPSEEEA